MKISAEELYNEMMATIELKKQQSNKTDFIESCFWIASKYWEQLKKNIDKSYFEYEGKEINFFRNIKPKFTGQIQFYTILAEAFLFVPEDPEDEVFYWKDELNRYKRFCERHKRFVDYYESKEVNMDSIYFTKLTEDWVPNHNPLLYDSDINFCSPQDHLVRGLVAHKLFDEFVKEKLKELGAE